MISDVCSGENVSVDIQKMTPVQMITGSQYLTKYLVIIALFLLE